jgi:hypothetical protein
MIFWTLPILFSENIFLAQRPLLNSCDWVVITLNSSFRCTESTGRQRELNRVLIGSVLLLLGRELLVTWRALLVLRIFSLLILRSLSMFLRPWLSVAWEIADIVLFWYSFCIRSSMLHVSIPRPISALLYLNLQVLSGRAEDEARETRSRMIVKNYWHAARTSIDAAERRNG